MKKRGFTLVELATAITVLGIIALIATPIMINMIEISKKGMAKEGANNYLLAVDTAISTQRFNSSVEDGLYYVMTDGNLCKGIIDNTTCDGKKLKVQVSGTFPGIGSQVVIENEKAVEHVAGSPTIKTILIINGYNVVFDDNGILNIPEE